MKNKNCSHLTRRQFIKSGLTGFAIGSSVGILGCDPMGIPLPTATRTETEDDVPALIIGSGFGGAVTALRLGEAGIQTMVLEQGRRWDTAFSRNIPPDGRSTWLRNKTILPFGPEFSIQKYTGVLDRVDYPNMKVYRGTAVGGGSIVYGGISIEPPEELFYEVFPRGVSYQELHPYYDRVRDILGISTVPADIEKASHYEYARVFAKHAANAGLEAISIGQAADWDIIRSEIAGTILPSAIIGEMLYGGNSDYKNSLDRNYLPMAEATGYVTIHSLHRVTNIRQHNSGKYAVTVENIDETGKVLQTKEITTTSLFFAAGSIGTTELLVKARHTGNLAKLNEDVGKGWGTNGNVLFSRSIDESTGKMQGGPVIIGVSDYGNTQTPASVESVFLPIVHDCRCLLQLLIGLDTERGDFSYDSIRNKAVLNWSSTGNARAASAAADFTARMNAANGGTLGISEGVPFPIPDVSADFTYQPLGGMVMGKACDFYGRVHGYPRMYVMDGSLLPGSCATANPSLTIAAFAERNIERILTDDLTMNREKIEKREIDR
ncbi:MAG: GMC oxidoreductase [Candidatus Poribacteria bacterium]|nr:GMC oxidoreductase [Candidatus Poribacteria bacterium]